jgi:hypothetical protein
MEAIISFMEQHADEIHPEVLKTATGLLGDKHQSRRDALELGMRYVTEIPDNLMPPHIKGELRRMLGEQLFALQITPKYDNKGVYIRSVHRSD